ncbi:MAG: hypothetical protein QM813_28035 [Verrucomicrobiota bacterium]
MFSSAKAKLAVAVAFLALVLVPAPLLPPLGLAEFVHLRLGLGWKAAYFLSAVGLQGAFYGSLGVIVAFAAGPGEKSWERWLRLVVLPVAVVGIALGIRVAKVGHWPIFINAIVPVSTCGLGVVAGLLFRQHGWRVTLAAMGILLLSLGWAYWPGESAGLSRATKIQLQRITAAAPGLPATGEQRFAALMQSVFAPLPEAASQFDAVTQNRAAIVALGITIGHERLARYAGLARDSELVRQAVAVRSGTTLSGREDWARHYCLSAALAVVENPFLSDAGGLMKEQLDALAHGSGFSFGDLAADRAGVRFAEAATASPAQAVALQTRLQGGFLVADFFPAAGDLPENLTVAEFRQAFDGVGSPRYRAMINEIEARLDRCSGLVSP